MVFLKGSTIETASIWSGKESLNKLTYLTKWVSEKVVIRAAREMKAKRGKWQTVITRVTEISRKVALANTMSIKLRQMVWRSLFGEQLPVALWTISHP